mgnify:CR=1 FL=1
MADTAADRRPSMARHGRRTVPTGRHLHGLLRLVLVDTKGQVSPVGTHQVTDHLMVVVVEVGIIEAAAGIAGSFLVPK